jgi:hypothetical protein
MAATHSSRQIPKPNVPEASNSSPCLHQRSTMQSTLYSTQQAGKIK